MTASTPSPPLVLYLVHREGLASVLPSVAGVPLELLRRSGVATKLVVSTPIGEFVRAAPRRRWREQKAALGEVYSGLVHRLPSPPARMQSLWSDAYQLRRWCSRHVEPGRELVIHARGLRAVASGLELKTTRGNTRVVYDMRGWEAAEYALTHLGGPGCESVVANLGRLEERAVAEADAVISVSRSMQAHVRERYNRDSALIPCCVDPARYGEPVKARPKMRGELGVTDRFVVVYCGGTSAWQSLENSLAFFRRIQNVEPSALLLVVTSQPATMRDFLGCHGLSADRYRLHSGPHTSVAPLLAAADLGLLVRDASDVNRVASPVKYAEYLAAGTPVAITEGVGDYSTLTANEGLGLVITADLNDSKVIDFIDHYRHHEADTRDHCRTIAAKDLSWDLHLPTLLTSYGISAD